MAKEDLPIEVTKLENRSKTVRSAQLLLASFALKPMLLKILANLNATRDLMDFNFDYVDWMETTIPIVLAVVWLIVGSWRLGYLSAFAVIAIFILDVNKDETILSTTPILGCYIFVICMCVSGAAAGRLIFRIKHNFPELYDLYMEEKSKKIKDSESKNK